MNYQFYNLTLYNKTKERQSVYAKVTLFLSSIVNKYKITIAINLKLDIFSKSIIFGIYPAYSIYSLKFTNITL